MIIGVPKEVKDNEYRVALTPEGALELTHAGPQVGAVTSRPVADAHQLDFTPASSVIGGVADAG